jgi:predicted nucleic acid-binding protein
VTKQVGRRGFRQGRGVVDQIAGIAAARRATLATRNIRHFADLGVELIDPWSA